MNPLIKKEIRLILPAWIAAMLLAIFPMWIAYHYWSLTPDDTSVISFATILGVLFLGIASFGQEFSFRTFPLLLSQPVSRRRIWSVKITVLAAAFVSTFLALFVSWQIFADMHHFGNWFYIFGFASHFEMLAVIALAVLSGGLWTALLLRQVTGAFWFALLLPMAMNVLLLALAGWLGFGVTPQMQAYLLLLYSIAGFFLARKMFFHAQDAQWTGGNIMFPWRRRKSVQTSSFVLGPFRNRFLTLIWKEIQLHEVNLFLALILFALTVISILVRTATSNSNLKMALEFVPGLWLLMPLLIGSAAVAEERKLGTMESQLCLPVSRRAQFSIKFFVALVLSMVLGTAIPLLMGYRNDFRIFEHVNLWVFIAAPSTFFISFYASTLSRSTIQAMGTAIGIPIVAWSGAFTFFKLVFHSGEPQDYVQYENAGRANLMIYLGVPVLLLVVARLMFWNFKWLHQDWKLWRRNITAIVVSFAFVFVLTNAIYYRMWELLEQTDPSHGAARLSDSTPPKFVMNQNTISATLPDGRLWDETLAFDSVRNRENHETEEIETIAPGRSSSQFIGGTNWVEVTAGNFQTLGVQSDGSLWSIQGKLNLSQGWWIQTGNFKLTQIGSETNWLHAAGGSLGFLLLKKDGSLWVWGTNSYSGARQSNDILARKLKEDLAAPPASISPETDWTEVFTSGWPNFAAAKKNDGSIWSLRFEWNSTNYVSRFVENTNFNGQWSSRLSHGDCSAGVKTNGELWLFGPLPPNWNWNDGNPPDSAYLEKTQLGKNAKWKAVTFSNWPESFIALRDDGTLWKWSWRQSDSAVERIRVTQLGNHSDWIALSTHNWWNFALAADGGLWAWGERSAHIWLAPSRRPVLIGNIFQGTVSKAE